MRLAHIKRTQIHSYRYVQSTAHILIKVPRPLFLDKSSDFRFMSLLGSRRTTYYIVHVAPTLASGCYTACSYISSITRSILLSKILLRSTNAFFLIGFDPRFLGESRNGRFTTLFGGRCTYYISTYRVLYSVQEYIGS